MSSSVDHPVEGEGADEDFVEAAADAPDVTENDDGNDDAESYDTEDEDPVEVIRAHTFADSSTLSQPLYSKPKLFPCLSQGVWKSKCFNEELSAA